MKLKVKISLVCVLLFVSMMLSAVSVYADCTLPDIVHLGTGKGDWVLPENYDGFLVKSVNPFEITKVNGLDLVTTKKSNEVWASTQFTETLITLYDSEVNFGTLQAGDNVTLVIIDDNVDSRETVIAGADGYVYASIANQPGLISYITFQVAQTDTYKVVTHDSIGFVKACVSHSTDVPEELEPLPLIKVFLPWASY